MKRIILNALAFVLALNVGSSFAQLSEGGMPYSFSNVVPTTNVQTINVTKPNLQVLQAEDAQNDERMAYRVGLNLPVNITPANSGTWQSLPNGGDLWRLEIHSDDAMALGLYYSNFYIPDGGEVFIYNDYKNQVIGAFTSRYNVNDIIRATQMIQGSTLTIEYYAAPGTIGAPIIEINSVAYFYRGVEDFIDGYIQDATGQPSSYSLQKADPCQVDVACSPENNGWQNQIDAAIHYTFTQGASTYVCSASMVNNTSQDCTPYVLSAWHCGEPNAGSNINSWVWYWNYQKTSCSPGSANGTDPSKGTDTMTGGTVVASSGNGTLNNPPGTNQVAGSDFYLVELTSEPPTSYNAYYAGWNRANTGATSGVGVHHPAGSAKKISTYTSSLSSTTYNGGAAGAHWLVTWAGTTNGHGVTEGGSSGSPIFDQNGRIVGQLSGGSSYCTATSSPDLYGKFYTDWDLNGTASTAQLEPWLDPTGTGVMTLDGTYQPCNSTSPPTCGINASSTTITVGGSVNFSDGSTGNPTAWNWDFDNTGNGGALPASSTAANPGSVTFNNIGTYEVELIASNANGACTTTVNINVVASVGCDTLLNIGANDTLTIYGANGGYVSGWNGYGDVSKAEAYSGYSPYTHVNGMVVYFYGIHDGGSGATVDFNIWDDNAGQPGTIIATESFPLSTIDGALTNGQGLLEVLFPGGVNVGGNPFYCGITMNGFGANDSLGIVHNSIFDPTANSAWEEWGAGGGWYAFDDASSWGNPYSMYISPYVTDAPVSGSASSNVTTVCAGGSIDYSSTGTNVTGYNWIFNGGTPANSTNQNETVTYSTAGNYTAYLVLEGSCDGQAIDSIQVVISDGPTITSNGTDPGCAGNDGQIVITATGGATPYQYSIDNGVTFQSSGTFTGLTDGTYDIVVQDNNGCQSTDQVTLNPGSGTLVVSSTSNDPSCGANDGDITVTVTGGTAPYTFSNDGGATFNSGTSPYTFTNLGTGTYDIVVQDNNGCQGNDQVTLNNPGAPSMTFTSTDLSCNGAGDGSITVTATGGNGTYSFSNDGGTTFNSGSSPYTFNNLGAGSYDLVVEDGNGCQSSVSTATLTEPTAVTHTATSTDASCGANNGTITVTASGGSTPYQYSIDNGANYQTSGSFTGLGAGSYQVIVMDNNGCTSVMSTEIISSTGNVTATAAVTNETCMNANGEIVISATGGSTPYQYSIDGGATFQSGSTFSGLSAGTYNVVVEDAGGCQGTTTATITNTGGVTPTISADQTICFGNTATITAGGAGTGGSYSWDNGLGTGSTHVVSPASTTTYTVTITDATGCQATESTTITVETQPNVTVSPSTADICAGESITLTASGAQTYVWNTGATTASITVSPTSMTTYTVIGQNGSCSGSPVQTTVTVSPAPTVVAGADQVNIPVGGTVNFSNAGSVATSYSWNFGDGNSSTQGMVSHTYNVQGTYTVVLTGTLGNCTGTDTITINVGVNDIDEVNLTEAVNLFPNPNEGEFKLTIELSEAQDVNISLYNTIGQQLELKTLNNITEATLDFNLRDKAEGFYFINVETRNGSVTKRISILR